MLKAIFYARFHPERGPTVIHQHPHGSVVSQVGLSPPLFTWSDVSSYIIPPYDVCNQPLSICPSNVRILGFPISLEDPKYARNRFTFNVCFVLSEDEDVQPWNPIVRKTARFFSRMESLDGLLQAEENLPGLKWAGDEGYPTPNVGTIHSLLQRIMDDLNLYGEACIQLDILHVLNLRLEHVPTEPRKVQSWDVPLLVRALPDQAEWTWDLTLQRIHPYLDGVNHVQSIAELADVEVRLVKQAVWELMYHRRAILIDIFHHQASYACTEAMTLFVKDQEIQDECCKYVATTSFKRDLKLAGRGGSTAELDAPNYHTIIELYCALEPGLTLVEFCGRYRPQLTNVDIRRFVTFGVTKGIIRRLHKYILAIESRPTSPSLSLKKQSGVSSLGQSQPKSSHEVVKDFDRAWRKAALSSGWATPPSGPPLVSLMETHRSGDMLRSEEDHKLRRFLNGQYRLDQICVAMHLSAGDILARLREGHFGEFITFEK